MLKIIESNRARESAIPTYGERQQSADAGSVRDAPSAARARQPRRSEGACSIASRAATATSPATRRPTRSSSPTWRRTSGAWRTCVKSARRADGRREDLGHQAAHGVGDRHGAMLSSIFNVAKGGAAPPAASAATEPRGQFGAAAGGALGGGPPGSDLSVSQIIPDDRQNILVIVSTEKAYRRILALVKRLDQMSMRTGDDATDLVHVVPLENANADDIAGTLGGLGAAVSRGSSSGSSAPGGRPSAPHRPAARRDRRPACSKATCASPRTSRPTRWSSWRRGATTSRCATSSRSSTCRGRRCSSRRPSSRSRSTRRASSASPGTAASPFGTGSDQSLLFGGSEPSSDVNSILFSPAALSGLAAGLRGPAIPGADKILGLPPGTSVPSFGVFVQALQNNGDVNVVSMPHILTTDNEKATIQVGQNLPFPGSLGGFPTAGVPGATGGGASAGRDLRLRHLGAAPGRGAQARDHAARQRLRLRAPGDRQRALGRVEPELQRARPGDDQAHGQVGGHHPRSAVDRPRRPHQGSRVRNGEQGAAARRHPDPRISVQVDEQDDHQAEPAHHPDAVHHQGPRRSAARSSSARCASGASSWSATRRSATTGITRPRSTIDRKRGLLEEINRTAIEAEEEAAELRAAEQRCSGATSRARSTLDTPPPVRAPVTPSVGPDGTVGAPPAPERRCRRTAQR